MLSIDYYKISAKASSAFCLPVFVMASTFQGNLNIFGHQFLYDALWRLISILWLFWSSLFYGTGGLRVCSLAAISRIIASKPRNHSVPFGVVPCACIAMRVLIRHHDIHNTLLASGYWLEFSLFNLLGGFCRLHFQSPTEDTFMVLLRASLPKYRFTIRVSKTDFLGVDLVIRSFAFNLCDQLWVTITRLCKSALLITLTFNR